MTDQERGREQQLEPSVQVFGSVDELNRAAADLVAQIALGAVERRSICSIALTGGSSPCGLYRLLADNPYRHMMPWDRIHLFWGDERCVPPDHPDSNFRLAQLTLLSKIPIAETNVHRMRGEEDPGRAAREYHDMLRDYFEPAVGCFPRMDLILLGLGEDGHVASLFPNGLELGENARFAIETQKPGGWQRISLSLPTINAAQNVLFLVMGEKKAGMLPRALGDADRFVPATLVRPTEGRLFWFADRAAAANLEHNS